jgi:DNA processing protein
LRRTTTSDDIARARSKCAGLPGARAIANGDEDYPPGLLDLENPPDTIFSLGSLKMLHPPVVAIVGTRSCSRYGERVARELAVALASAGASVVSGLARGIDAAAHRGSLAVSGRTCAVLGTGLDVVYPAGHASLQREIGEKGLLVTEMSDGERPHRGSFPSRNRIIAALASVTIVVEAGRKSGALSTARHALALNRTVAAVPGPIDSLTTVGSNQLMRDGAQIIAEVEDALSLAGLSRRRVTAPPRNLSATELMVLRTLGDKLLTTEQLVSASALPVSECLVAISALELEGMVETNLMGELQRRAGFSRQNIQFV